MVVVFKFCETIVHGAPPQFLRAVARLISIRLTLSVYASRDSINQVPLVRSRASSKSTSAGRLSCLLAYIPRLPPKSESVPEAVTECF